MATCVKGRSAMLAPLHRFFDRLFHGHHTAHPPVVLPAQVPAIPQRPGIPDALLDKLPPVEERHGDQHYARDPVSGHFVAVPDSHEHAGHRGATAPGDAPPRGGGSRRRPGHWPMGYRGPWSVAGRCETCAGAAAG